MAPVTTPPEPEAPPMARLAPTDDDIRRFEQRAWAHLWKRRLNPHEERVLLAEAAGVNIETGPAREIIRRIDREVASRRRRRRWRTTIGTALVLMVTAGLLAAIVRTWTNRPAEMTPEAIALSKAKARPAEPEPHVDKRLYIGNDVSLGFVLIPSGKLLMGSDKYRTQREVTITRPFYMGVTEVTQAQWQAVMGTEPWKGRRYAKEGAGNALSWVSWNDATAFCTKVSQKAARTVRLPTEAEWEYACRAGNKTAYCFGDDVSKLGDYAWYKNNAWDIREQYPHPVGQKKPNAWGPYDMHGNVWEWCRDWYDEKYYAAGGDTVDPTGPASGSSRVLRGGSFFNGDGNCRSAIRDWTVRDYRIDLNGFRVVLPVVARGLPR